jgi:phenylalanyl-tRNA synthetase beta chain
MARAQSILGVARKIAAVSRGTLRESPALSPELPSSDALVPHVTVPELCRRFSVAEIENLAVSQSPRWMQRRLALCGVGAVDNVVDAVNYVLLELGQPMHTYDAAKLPDRHLGVRLSHGGERLRTLAQSPDQPEPTESPSGILLIVSGETPVGVAGVISGSETAISPDTTRILVESANFDFIAIRKSQAATKTFSEASARFSRSVDPSITVIAIRRLIRLLSEMCTSLQIVGSADWALLDPEPHEIATSLQEVNAALGTDYELRPLVELLNAEGIFASADDRVGVLHATIPSGRADLRIPADLLEEFVRIDGYDKIPESMPADPIPMHAANTHLQVREAARDALVRWGLHEVIAYTLTTPEVERKLLVELPDTLPEPAYIRVLNPISADRVAMRRTLLPGLFEAIRFNSRFEPAIHVFEVGVVVLPEEPSAYPPGPPGLPPLPGEPYRVAIAMTGPLGQPSVHGADNRPADFFNAADAITFLLNHLHVPAVHFDDSDEAPYQPGACAAVFSGTELLGHVGVLHPRVAEAFDLADNRIVCAELNLEKVIQRSVRFFRFDEPPRFPSVASDISVVVADRVKASALLEAVRGLASNAIRTASIFDLYQRPQVPPGHKAVGLRPELNAGNRTLTVEEGRRIRDVAAAHLRELFGATVRE